MSNPEDQLSELRQLGWNGVQILTRAEFEDFVVTLQRVVQVPLNAGPDDVDWDEKIVEEIGTYGGETLGDALNDALGAARRGVVPGDRS